MLSLHALKDFMIWKEQEEDSTHTFYTLHDKPHRFSSSKSPNGADCKLNSTCIIMSASLLQIRRCITTMCAAVMVPIGHEKRRDKQQRQSHIRNKAVKPEMFVFQECTSSYRTTIWSSASNVHVGSFKP